VLSAEHSESLDAEILPPQQPQPMVVDELAPRRMESPPAVTWREVLAVLLLVAVGDVTIYRGHGFTGFAVFFLLAPFLLWMGAPRARRPAALWCVLLMLLALAGKLVWCGSTAIVVIGFGLLVAFAMALAGLVPHVLEGAVFASQTVWAGYAGIIQYGRTLTKRVPRPRRVAWLNYALPAIAFVMFSLLFVLANPDLLSAFGRRLEVLLNEWRQWLLQLSPEVGEIVFWLVAAWLSIGMIRPVTGRAAGDEDAGGSPFSGGFRGKRQPSPLYYAFRNTLLTVIILFAIYLVFEFKTLWFREFPEGFYYSGYAHQGAAWLTLALALATAILSLVFRGAVFEDPRINTLRKLAWIWSLENMLLAIAVYNRMYIYIGFNGMTRMRVVGLFGMTAVVVGFILVLWKIAHRRGFLWLIRRHLWTVAIAVYLYAMVPVDTFVVRYNVNRILAGDPAPSVQVSVHPIGSEGVLSLLPLLECEDQLIREGVRALLAQRLSDMNQRLDMRERWGWSAYQIADRRVANRLQREHDELEIYDDSSRRQSALQRFHDYAYRWY
jgi:hypothetical protein